MSYDGTMNGADDTRVVCVEKLVPGGDGLCREVPEGEAEPTGRGQVIFVPFVLAGEKLRVELREKKQGFARGEVIEILSPSAARVEAPCRYYGGCGGCNLQHMSYQEQLRQKLSIALDAFRRTGHLNLASLSIVPSAPFGYRNRVQFHRTKEGEIGFMAQESNQIVPIDHCLVAVPAVNRFLGRSEELSPGDASGAGARRFGLFAIGDGWVIEGDGRTIAVEILSRRFLVSADSFAQSNVSMLERLVSWVCSGISGDTAADLYGGAGLFSLFLRDRFTLVHLVEADRKAAALARVNLESGESQQAGRVEIHAERAESWLEHSGRRARLDAAVVDPPRQGLSSGVTRLLCARQIAQLVYVSCDPVTLARDASLLREGGYELVDCMLFDLYPQTSHIEAVARFVFGSGRGSPRGQSQ